MKIKQNVFLIASNISAKFYLIIKILSEPKKDTTESIEALKFLLGFVRLKKKLGFVGFCKIHSLGFARISSNSKKRYKKSGL